MRWKILELANNGLPLEEILGALEKQGGVSFDRQEALEILALYQQTFSEELQEELKQLRTK